MVPKEKKSRRKKRGKKNKNIEAKPVKSSRVPREEKSSEHEASDRSLKENGHTNGEFDSEDPLDNEPEPEIEESEPVKSNKKNRKSFYDYSDYGQLQDQLELSQESDFTASEEQDVV